VNGWFNITDPYHQLILFLGISLSLLLITKINTSITIGFGYFILFSWMMIGPIVWAFNDWDWLYILHLSFAIILYYILWVFCIVLHEKMDRELGMGAGYVVYMGVPVIFVFFIAVGIILKSGITLLSFIVANIG